ncbi:MAG: homoserine/homoserine lactone efflux protein [Rhodocyclales bacterium GT-UBC]|nr:MAG: homoserine/homoserine lactone efflux protein [Rhodocyclales bacterium GT-UBC]
MSFSVWLGFLLAAILIAVAPGPGAVVSMSTGMRYGYRSAFVVILGLQLALVCHLFLVAVGLGALLAASETAFMAVKLIGAGYLLCLGLKKWRAPVVPVEVAEQEGRPGLFVQGLLVNLTNPKAIVFIGALVPPFIDASVPQLPQYLIVGGTLCITDVVVMSAYAVLASRLGGWLYEPRAILLQNRVFGGLFAMAGAFLAVSSRPS